MLNPFDDYPIHSSADPIAHLVSGDPNHYDRYWFNGHQNDGGLFFGAAMGLYPVRGVIDAAFSVVLDGVEHSIFASGTMPLDRTTSVGPVHMEVLAPMRVIRFYVEPNEHGISCDLTFRAVTVAVEEPRQRRLSPEGVLLMDHTRMTQWGTWQGTITVDGVKIGVEAWQVSGTRDRSWGLRPLGDQVPNQRQMGEFQLFWLWAPLHFNDRFTHLALHEHADGSRWLETALVLQPLPTDAAPWSTAGVRRCRNIEYELEWKPGTREMKRAQLRFEDPVEGQVTIELEKHFAFRMRGIGYAHPYWAHGTLHGALEVGRESLPLHDVDPVDFSSLHVQNVVTATMGDRTGIGVLEQMHIGPHGPSGLTGLLDGYSAR
ncbi:hypothetical protein [Mycobacterium sp. UM_CSW]|uniref:hypothetical protein n=1 Tax=Mycobacterium sp. UM_CSW TaxID=1370119 RepID=UPI00042969B6|nr:hypothetical protein [Mycobacterium sp. UM_CSW]